MEGKVITLVLSALGVPGPSLPRLHMPVRLGYLLQGWGWRFIRAAPDISCALFLRNIQRVGIAVEAVDSSFSAYSPTAIDKGHLVNQAVMLRSLNPPTSVQPAPESVEPIMPKPDPQQ